MDTVTSLLGRCKDCDYTIFATREDVQSANHPSQVLAGAGVFRLNNGYVARCTNRHKFFQVKAIKGTYSEKHKCDTRCLNAKGWSCTCSCGGANHGRGHAVTVVNAAELPARTSMEDAIGNYGTLNREAAATTPAPVLKHLGEVGGTIRGEVFVKTVKSLANGSVLYSFRTVNGGNIIKWFCPGYADPGFEPGSTVTIRAKVKSHGEFNGAPETVVIYVEEVE